MEASAFDHPLDDQPPFGDEQTVRAEQLGFGHAAVRRDPRIIGPAMRCSGIVGSDHTGLSHDGFRLAADVLRHLEWVALLEFWQEQLDRERTRITLV